MHFYLKGKNIDYIAVMYSAKSSHLLLITVILYEVHALQKCQISDLVLPSWLLKAMAMMMFRTFKTDTYSSQSLFSLTLECLRHGFSQGCFVIREFLALLKFIFMQYHQRGL